jgi:DNA-binding HxlR family transcriptional regulator
MTDRTRELDHDAVARALELLGERWTLRILREAFFGVRRFGQMQRNLGIARNMLTARLQTLVDEGVLERRLYRTDPDWYEYRLTRKGLDLYPAIVSMMRWSEHYLAPPSEPKLEIRHSCGELVSPVVSCPECGEEIDALDVHIEDHAASRSGA